MVRFNHSLIMKCCRQWVCLFEPAAFHLFGKKFRHQICPVSRTNVVKLLSHSDRCAFSNDDAGLRNSVLTKQEVDVNRQGEGLENEGAVARALSGGETAKAEIAAIDEQIALTRNRIAALMGAGPDRGLALKRPHLSMNRGFGLPSNLPAELLGRRPDIVAARFRVEAANLHIDQAKADFYPNINLLGLIGLQSLGVGNLLMAGSGFGAVGPAFSLPIFDGGRLRAKYRGAEAGFAEAVATYDGTLTQALREVADTAASSRALAVRLKYSRAAEAEAQAAWKIASNRYKGGLGNYLDVLTSEDALINARRTVASLEARAFTLDIALIRALGGGYQFQQKGTRS